MAGKEPLVRFEEVGVEFRSSAYNDVRRLFSNLTFTLCEGESIALLGPNGSGKSTILKLILGESIPMTGKTVCAFGSRELGFVPQNYRKALFPWLKGSTVVALYQNSVQFFDTVFFENAIKELGLKNRIIRPIFSLSGGEQQLLLLLLVLSMNTKLLLLDEPFSAVDLKRRAVVSQILSERLKVLNCGCLLVTHDINDASNLTDNAIILSGTPEQEIISFKKENSERYAWNIRDAFYR